MKKTKQGKKSDLDTGKAATRIIRGQELLERDLAELTEEGREELEVIGRWKAESRIRGRDRLIF